MSGATAPWMLGAAGAIPFVCTTPQVRELLGYSRLVSSEDTARAQITYGATILSFLGGIHWGLAAVKHNNPTSGQLVARYSWAVTPSLLAWPALLMPEQLACGTLIGGLLSAAAVDTRYAASGGFPRWMLPLRYALTATACTSLLATGFRET